MLKLLNKNNEVKPSSNTETLGRVISIILDDSHPEFKNFGGWNSLGTIFWYEIDKINGFENELKSLPTAKPLNPNNKNFPLINEIVNIISGPNSDSQNEGTIKEYYYSSIFNIWNHPNHNAIPDNSIELKTIQSSDYITISNGSIRRVKDNSTEIKLGSYFKENLKLKPLLPYEGDFILEGRFGNSIRFGSTVLKAKNQNEWSKDGIEGDPILIFRNGQKISGDENWVPILEDINNDDTTIIMCSNHIIPINVSCLNLDSFNSNINNSFNQIQITDSPINPSSNIVPNSSSINTNSENNNNIPLKEEQTLPQFTSSFNNNIKDDFVVSEGTFQSSDFEKLEKVNIEEGEEIEFQETDDKIDQIQGNIKLSKYFYLNQMIRSSKAKRLGINNTPNNIEINNLRLLCLNILDNIYDLYGNKLNITSGFRSKALNGSIKGSSNTSQHCFGCAADLQVRGKDNITILNDIISLNLPFDQLIEEHVGNSKWIHISFSPRNRRQILKARSNPNNGKTEYYKVK